MTGVQTCALPIWVALYAFDFDGTLTDKDSLLAIIRYAKGSLRFWLIMLRFLPLMVLMKAGRYSNSRLKEKVLAYSFGGMEIGKFNELCRQFAASHQHLFREEGVQCLRQYLQNLPSTAQAEEGVYIVSASLINWVKPFFDSVELTDEERRHLFFLCTEAEVADGTFTGRFSVPNCYGPEKVRRLKERLLDSRSNYFITAYGDSRGDSDLLAFADQGFYKPFRQNTTPLTSSPLPMGGAGRGVVSPLPAELLRFILVGTTAVVIQYLVYLILIHPSLSFSATLGKHPFGLSGEGLGVGSSLPPTVANTVAYLVSFLFNYVASVRYTFRVKSSARRGLGFAFSHLVNYLLQTLLLTFFLWIGLDKGWAMLPVFAVCVPTNFLLVRKFLK